MHAITCRLTGLSNTRILMNTQCEASFVRLAHNCIWTSCDTESVAGIEIVRYWLGSYRLVHLQASILQCMDRREINVQHLLWCLVGVSDACHVDSPVRSVANAVARVTSSFRTHIILSLYRLLTAKYDEQQECSCKVLHVWTSPAHNVCHVTTPSLHWSLLGHYANQQTDDLTDMFGLWETFTPA